MENRTFLIGSLIHTYMDGRKLKDIKKISADTILAARRKYTHNLYDPAGCIMIVCIGEISDGITYLEKKYLEYTDWDFEMRRDILKPPYHWVDEISDTSRDYNVVNLLSNEEEKTNYIVGLLTGGVMEQPKQELIEVDIIPAASKEESVNIYNDRHNCDYYYGHCVGEINKGVMTLYMGDIKNIDIHAESLLEKLQVADICVEK